MRENPWMRYYEPHLNHDAFIARQYRRPESGGAYLSADLAMRRQQGRAMPDLRPRVRK